MAFDRDTRNKLSSFVHQCRRLLCGEYDRPGGEIARLLAHYGIQVTGEVTEVDQLPHLDESGRDTARLLREILEFKRANTPQTRIWRQYDPAVYDLLQEQAFTVLNRLCALRMAEARGILQPCVSEKTQSAGFQLYEYQSGKSDDQGTRYRHFLFSVFDEIALDLPALFDRFSPQGLLFPSHSCIEALLDEINAEPLQPLWAEDETIGWIYQYWNSQEERRAMRDASAAPRNSRELAVRNQFFTPRYVVEFLTDNTLGRIWYEMTKGETRLKDQCRYLVRRPNEIFLKEGEDPPDENQEPGTKNQELSQEELLRQPVHIPHRPLKDPREIRLLDPACGSMHFGLYAFDLFETIYKEYWELQETENWELKTENSHAPLKDLYSSKEAYMRDVPRLIIEHNVHGVDIDPRAVQIAGLSLWLRAQKTWQQANVQAQDRPQIMRSNVVCAEPMPGNIEQLQNFCESLNQPAIAGLVEHIFEKMQLAGEAGTLLKIEEEITELVATAKKDWLKAPKLKQAELFQADELTVPTKQDQSELGLDFSGVTDEAFWDKAEERIYRALDDYSKSADTSFSRKLFSHDVNRGFAFIDLCRKRYDAVVMNPPFGDGSSKAIKYFHKNYETTKRDVGFSFIDRFKGRSERLGVIVSRTCWFLSSFEDWRANLLATSTIENAADLGHGVLDAAMVETVAFTLGSGTSKDVDLANVFRLLNSENRESELASRIGFLSTCDIGQNLFLSRMNKFINLPGKIFSYWAPTEHIKLFEKKTSLHPQKAEVHWGLFSADDNRFLRAWWEIPSKSHGSTWVPYSKGGEFNEYGVQIELVVNWSKDGHEIRNNRHPNGNARSRIPNSEWYFKKGLTYSSVTNKGMAVRILPSGCIFSIKGPGIITKSEIESWFLLAYLNSTLGREFLFYQTASRSWDVPLVRRLPVPGHIPDELCKLAQKKNALLTLLRPEAETSKTYFFDRGNVIRLTHLGSNEIAEISSASQEWVTIGKQIDYGVEQMLGLPKGSSHRCENYENTTATAVSAECLSSFYSETDRYEHLLSLVLGTALGRWDIRYATGERQPPELPDPFDPLPVCPPGMLQGEDGLPLGKDALRRMNDEGGYPLRVTVDGILVDDANDPEDIVTRVGEALRVIWGDRATAIEAEAIEILQGEGRTPKDLRDYFRTPGQFFASHLARYSKSRRKAPIYWPISTASGDYTLWLYYHRLDDQTLLRCVNRIKTKLESVAQDRARLANESNRSSKEDTELKKLATFEEELRALQRSLEAISKTWKPNLNDGVQITAAPLWEHFNHKPWQKVLKDTWKQLQHGDYDWAHLAHSIWPERVVPKCAQDRSLAIAHGHESRLWHQVEVEGKKKQKKLEWHPVPNAEEVVAEILEELKAN